MGALSLRGHLSGQLERLCGIAGTSPVLPLELLSELLGATGARPLSEPASWPSDVADDHTPVEFSLAFNKDGPPTLRILAEALGSPPNAATNLSATYDFLAAQAARFGLSTSRLDRIRDLFAADRPQGSFGIWYSLVFRSGRPPGFKVYFNPEIRGVDTSPVLVAEALHRLGLGASYRTMLGHGVRPGELGRADRLTFFAVDLHDGPQARVKVYLSRYGATVSDVVRAARTVDGVDVAELARFCLVAGGGPGPFDNRPLVSSYTFTEAAATPVGFSLYVPIRSYVGDDEEARDRVMALLTRYGFDGGELDRAIAAVTRRPLRDGVGLIAHVSLRLGPPQPGVTVYLSSEAYRVAPPAARLVPAVVNPGVRLAGRAAAGHL